MRGDRLVMVVGGVLLAVVAGSAALALRFTGGKAPAGDGLVEVVSREDPTPAEPEAIIEPSFDHYRVVTEQNVFMPLLSPPRDEVALAVPAEIPSPTGARSSAPRPAPDPTIDLAMTGVVESNGGLMALIKNIRSDDSVYAGVDDSAFGLQVAAIEAKQVTFAQGEETYTLAMGEKDVPEKGAAASSRPATASRPASATAASGGGEGPRPGFGPRPALGFRRPGGGSERPGGGPPGDGGGSGRRPGGGRGSGGGRGDGGGRGSGGGGRGPGGGGGGGGGR